MAIAQTIYMTVIALGLAMGLFWGFWTYAASVLVDVIGPYRFLWGPPAIALVLLAALRYNTLQGFASYSEADCLYLLGAPVRRRDLVILRLRVIAIEMGLAGALIGLLAGLSSEGRSIGAERMAEAIVAGAAFAVIVVAAGWQVQRLQPLSTWVVRLTIPAFGLVALLTIAGRRGGTAATAAMWSGPWGWAVLPFGATHRAGSVAGPLLLVGVAALGWIGVHRTAGEVSLESFEVRARVRSNAVASLYALDARSLLLAGRKQSAGRWRARITLHMPRRPDLAVSWHGLLLLLRSPMRLGWAVIMAAAGAVVLGLHPGSAGTSWAGALLFYLSATALMEPIRVEMDSPGTASILLPWRMGRVLELHCLVPATIMLGVSLIGVAVGWAVGLVAGDIVPGLVILVVVSVAVQVLAAALSAKRGGRVPQELLMVGAGDATGLAGLNIVGWILGWAFLGIAAVGLAATLTLGKPHYSVKAIAVAVVLLVALAGIFWARLGAAKKAEGEKKGSWLTQ